jgi:hypothetical protein
MSNFLAIATVTETLRQILDAAAAASKIAEAKATAVRPTTGTTALPAVGVNLYLYQVTPNSALRNVDQPTRRGDGTVLEPPQIALDLHYLLTFYGKEQELEPHRMMGSVLRYLNSRPLLTRESIRNAKLSVSALADSNLDEQLEFVRLIMMPMTLEEMSKLWSVFLQTPYVPSIVYQASVVLIRGDEVAQPALPVRSRNLYVRTFRQPVIEQILSQRPPASEISADRPLVVGDTVYLTGRQLRGDVTRVRLGTLEITPTEVSDTRITFQLDMPPFPAQSLRAGVHGVQVIQHARMGTPESDHAGNASNVSAFVLRPVVTATAVPISSHVVDGVALCTDDLTLNFTPRVGVRQRVALILNEFNPPADRTARAYCFEVSFTPSSPTDTSVASIVTRVEEVVAGDYLVRVQVDGAESPLKPGPDPSNPIYFEPKVTIS